MRNGLILCGIMAALLGACSIEPKKPTAKIPAPWTVTISPNGASVQLNDTTAMEFAKIPAGTFIMGAPKGEVHWVSDWGGPQHEVEISKAFYFGIYPVTQEQYQAVTGKNPSKIPGANFAVENISWLDAVNFCAALSLKTGKKVRLPTEAEWEYACRAGTTTRYSFGDDEKELDAYGWHANNSDGKPHAVGLKKPNPWGLYDMHGGVQNWCSDYFAWSYAGLTERIDPQGAREPVIPGKYRSTRGVSWGTEAWLHGSAVRRFNPENARGVATGFRLVMEVEQQSATPATQNAL